jgi:hypothetical protein
MGTTLGGARQNGRCGTGALTTACVAPERWGTQSAHASPATTTINLHPTHRRRLRGLRMLECSSANHLPSPAPPKMQRGACRATPASQCRRVPRPCLLRCSSSSYQGSPTASDRWLWLVASPMPFGLSEASLAIVWELGEVGPSYYCPGHWVPLPSRSYSPIFFCTERSSVTHLSIPTGPPAHPRFHSQGGPVSDHIRAYRSAIVRPFSLPPPPHATATRTAILNCARRTQITRADIILRLTLLCRVAVGALYAAQIRF